MSQFFVHPQDVDLAALTALVTGEEAHHLAKVQRLGEGETVRIFDGQGRRWQGVLASVSRDCARVCGLIVLNSNEPPGEVRLLASLIMADRWDWLLEKAVEAGATRITPVLANRCQIRLGDEKSFKKADKWRKKALSAAKQCERGLVPLIDEPLTLGAALKALGDELPGQARLVLDPQGERDIAEMDVSYPILLAIGPEGGFDEGERSALAKSGFKPAKLGDRILRAETAALACLFLAQNRTKALVTGRHA